MSLITFSWFVSDIPVMTHYNQLRSLIKSIGILWTLCILLGILSCGMDGESEVKSKIQANSPPTVTSVEVLPRTPTKESELNLTARSRDPDRDPVTYRYQWMKNNEEIPGENKNILKGGNFIKGDLVQANVIPSDGQIEGKPFLSAPVRILNSPPVIQEVRIEPKMAYASDSLRVNIRSYDVDGDSIDYTYQWEKNGAVLSEERSEVLEGGRFIRGDSIAVTVTPDDRESQGSPKRSEPITIFNSPPVIVSSPPTSMQGNDYTYQVKASDPDNDPIFFSLRSAPTGMKIDKETGLIQWTIQAKDKGTHSIEVEASDKEGAKSFQRFSLNVEIR